jgi:hypothetical protein
MPVGMLMMAPGFTKETYDQVSEKTFGKSDWGAADAPEGLIVHSAGPAENGWYVYDIWESREDFERFLNEKLMPAFAEVLGEPPQGAQPQFFEIANLVRV